MDKEHANFERVFNDVREHLTPKVLPVEIPVGDGPQFRGIINLLTQTCQLFKAGSKAGNTKRCRFPRVPGRVRPLRGAAHRGGGGHRRRAAGEVPLRGEHPREQVVPAMKKAMLAGEIVPLFCGSGELQHGVRPLLTEMVEPLPAPEFLRRWRPPWWDGSSRRCPSPTLATCPSSGSIPADQERRRGVERGAQRRREAESPLGAAGPGASGSGRAEPRRYRVGRQAEGHPHRRYLLAAGASGPAPPLEFPEGEAPRP